MLETYYVIIMRPGHPVIYLYKAESVEHALAKYLTSEFLAELTPDGKWESQYGVFDSAVDAIAMGGWFLSFECRRQYQEEGEVYCGIDWHQLLDHFDDFYMRPARAVGRYFEWWDDRRDLLVLYPSPSTAFRMIAKAGWPRRLSILPRQRTKWTPSTRVLDDDDDEEDMPTGP